MNFYDFNDIQKHFDDEIAETEAKLQAWKDVKWKTKKDGKPYENMNRNFDGATYTHEEYVLQAGENVLKVFYNTQARGYNNDKIDCYCFVDDCTDIMKQKAKNYMPKNMCLKQVYRYDFFDIVDAINSRIKYLENKICIMKRQLERAEYAYTIFKTSYQLAKDELAEITEKDKNPTLYYNILQCVQKNY